MHKWPFVIFPSVLMLSGCVHPSGPLSVKNPDPTEKIPAIKMAVKEDDRSVAPQLVHDLESDDAAVRFYAIEGLRRLTGEEFGYRYYDDKVDRHPAVVRWQQWLKENAAAMSEPKGKRK